MKLNLKKPLVIFDLETTGLNFSVDKIIEISMLKIEPNSVETKFTSFINPLKPIPPHITEINNITDEMVKNAPSFKELSSTIINFIGTGDNKSSLGGYNVIHFDIPFLQEEFLANKIEIDLHTYQVLDIQKIFFNKEPRNLAAAYKFYCQKEITDAHRAENDTQATYEVLLAQIEKYQDIGNSVDEIINKTEQYNYKTVDFANRIIKEKGIEIFNFGKFKGQAVADVFKTDYLKNPQDGYYHWIMRGSFTNDTKLKFTEIFNRVKNNLN
ncbi:MAG: 3'-5' exonuclease [Sediminibacterium sp.]|nr:3'-5' exonuclease [Sediminibacterium sp.]